MKRFWDEARVIETANGCWSVALDGKTVRIPAGPPLALPTRALAAGIATEWQRAGAAKGGETSYDDLPLTRLAGTVQHRIAPDPGPVVLELARYGQSDLLCYRASQPQSLVSRQSEQWQPWLDWARDVLGAELRTTEGIVHIGQSETALSALAVAVARHDAHRLGALSILVPSYGSLVLGLAVAAGALSASEGHEIATVDERHQAEFWGRDHEAEERMARIAEDVAACGRFLDLCAA